MRNPNPRPFNLDASLLQCDLPLSLSLVKSSVALGGEEGRRLAVWKETDWSGPKGYFCFLVPLIPDTSGIRGLAQVVPKGVFSLPIPFYVISKSKKVYNLDSN